MKKIAIILSSIILLLSLQSCEKWFDITANNQIKAEDQFASANGFRDALIGVYIKMGSPALYAKDMTYNLVDLLSQQYTGLQNLATYFNIQQFNYQHVRSQDQIQAVWDNQYNTIANINSALHFIDETEFTWNSIDYRIIKGELLALRAFLHFDLMRTFGRSGYANRPELASHPAIPYVNEYNKELTGQLGYGETFALLEKDITDALELLTEDPIYPNSGRPSNYYDDVNRNGFYNDRTKRMNYYAAKALQARVLAWQGTSGKLALAAAAAEEVINNSPAILLTSSTDVSVNTTLPSEHLFGLNVEGLSDIANPLLQASDATAYNSLRIPPALAQTVYETSNPNVGLVDIRYNNLLESQALGMVPVKLRQSLSYRIDRNLVPLIKLPEMYYIAAEYYAGSNMARAVELLNEVRQSRRIISSIEPSVSPEVFQQELLKEYRKEYVSEGQLFFYYKRLGLATIPNYSTSVIADDDIYMLPYPVNEVQSGNRVQ